MYCAYICNILRMKHHGLTYSWMGVGQKTFFVVELLAATQVQHIK